MIKILDFEGLIPGISFREEMGEGVFAGRMDESDDIDGGLCS